MFFGKKDSSVSWILVFLGNPGAKYNGTRHNVGFMTADEVESYTGTSIKRVKFKALTATCQLGGQKVLLMKPQTYMNNSGQAVSEAQKFYKVPTDHILVISDDVTLPVGKLRIRRSGSAGGHNGLKNIIALCGGEGFPRIKIGVGAPPHPDYEMVDWVMGVFKGKDAEDISQACKTAVKAAETLIEYGPDKAMNMFN